MGRLFYSDYVKHMLRFYSRSRNITSFKSDVDKTNWKVCDTTLNEFPINQRNMLIEVYAGYGTLPDEVCNVAIKYNVDTHKLWDLMKDVEKNIARNRGLI